METNDEQNSKPVKQKVTEMGFTQGYNFSKVKTQTTQNFRSGGSRLRITNRQKFVDI